MQKATVIDFQEFRRRREAQQRQQTQTAQFVPMMPVMMWYPIQWVWTWPAMPARQASATV